MIPEAVKVFLVEFILLGVGFATSYRTGRFTECDL